MNAIIRSIVVFAILSVSGAASAGDWEPESGGWFILCDTKKNARKYDYPTRIKGCKMIETGPYQSKCVKSCMFGAKKMKFNKPTRIQIEGFNSGKGWVGSRSKEIGKYPESNRQLAPYYGKDAWMKQCPRDDCTHY